MQQVVQILLKTKLIVSEGVESDGDIQLQPSTVLSLFLPYKK